MIAHKCHTWVSVCTSSIYNSCIRMCGFLQERAFFTWVLFMLYIIWSKKSIFFSVHQKALVTIRVSTLAFSTENNGYKVKAWEWYSVKVYFLWTIQQPYLFCSLKIAIYCAIFSFVFAAFRKIIAKMTVAAVSC